MDSEAFVRELEALLIRYGARMEQADVVWRSSDPGLERPELSIYNEHAGWAVEPVTP